MAGNQSLLKHKVKSQTLQCGGGVLALARSGFLPSFRLFLACPLVLPCACFASNLASLVDLSTVLLAYASRARCPSATNKKQAEGTQTNVTGNSQGYTLRRGLFRSPRKAGLFNPNAPTYSKVQSSQILVCPTFHPLRDSRGGMSAYPPSSIPVYSAFHLRCYRRC